MRFNQSHPFLKAEESAGGTSVPAVSGPDSVRQSRVGEASDAKHPLDARPASILEDDEGDLGKALLRGSSDRSRGKEQEDEPQSGEPSFFDPGFDVSTLEEPLQGKFREMEAALNERMAQIPDAEAMSLIGQKAEMLDALVRDQRFQKWAEEATGTEHQPSVGERAASEAKANLLDGLDEDVQLGIAELIQSRVDEAIADRVAPLSDAFYAKEANATIGSLKEQYGQETFDRLAPAIHRLMEVTEGLDVTQAFKLARFNELETRLAKAEQGTVQKKMMANMEGDGSVGTRPASRKQARNFGEALEQAIDMYRTGDPGLFNPAQLPPGYRG